MRKSDVVKFFDLQALDWDANMIKDDEIIGIILDNAHVHSGVNVLDVACGTGVLIPYLQERKVASVTAIDISSEMVKIAKSKFEQDGVTILCGDVEETEFSEKFDCIIVYNAFPHFPNPDALIGKLSSLLKKSGYLTVAHGMSRERIDAHHEAVMHVSNGLMHEDDLAKLFEKHTVVTTKISDGRMYQITGQK